MPITQPAIYALNRGLISQLGLARTDLKRMALSASIQTNLMPRMLGSAMCRPGLQFIGSTLANARAKMIPFIFGTTDVLLAEATNNTLRFWLPGASGMPDTILTRPAVTTAIANGTFAGSLAGWTNNDGSGTLSQWVAGNLMQLVGNGFNAADEYQAVAPGGGDAGIEHAVRLVVVLGTVTLNIGVSQGDGTYARNLSLGRGTHSIAFTPAGTFYVDISNATEVRALVGSVAVEPAGALTLPTPWATADLQTLRWWQSANVIYVGCAGIQQQKILRWGQAGQNGDHSFSVALYQPLDGPFGLENITATTMQASGTHGEVILTASANYFLPGHVGALFRLGSQGGAVVDVAAAGTNQWSAALAVTGVGSQRYFTVIIAGAFTATVVLQQSVGAIGAWTDVGVVTPGTSGIPTTADWAGVGNLSAWNSVAVNGSVYDGFDNQIIYYRIGIESAYTSGTADCALGALSGSVTGICRVSNYISPTQVDADVLIQPGNTGTLSGFGNALPTNQWWEGIWSDVMGWPGADDYFAGGIWWAGKNWIVRSVSDAYESFDDTVTGSSAPIIQGIGSGPVDTINWLLGLADLLMGAQGAELVIRSADFSGVVSATDFSIKPCATQGSAPCPALKIDFDAFFLQRSGRRIYMLTYTPSFFLVDYKATDLTNFVPDIAIMENGAPLSAGGFNWLAVQRQPDTRIHALLNDGTARVMVFDAAEDEHAWIKVQLGASRAGAAVIEDVVVLPGQGGATSAEDLVYYVVNRTINGSTLRSLERWAREDECIGQALSKCADAHAFGTNSPPSAVIGGLGHLVGENVICWADGVDQGGPFTVSGSGTITLPNAVTNYCAGLGYTWQFQSTKLAYAAQLGTALLQKKRVARIGVLTANMAYQALQYGRDFNSLMDLPSVYKGGVIAPGTVFTQWDDEAFAFDGAWDTDSRVCLQGHAPRPVTVLGMVIDMELREGS